MRINYIVSIVLLFFVGLSASADAYYLVGSINNYNAPVYMSEIERGRYALTDENGDSIYSLTINIPKGQLNFVLFKEIAGWDSENIYWAQESVDLIDESYFVDGVLTTNEEKYIIPDTGEEITVYINSACRDAGTIDNQISGYEIVDGDKNSRVGNYEVTKIAGTLTVEKRNVTITTESYVDVYNATPQKNEVVFVDNSLVENGSFTLQLSEETYETFTFFNFAEITNVGRAENSVEFQVVKFEKLESSLDNYNITEDFGSLQVTPRPVIITAVNKAQSWIYDGENHTYTEYTEIPQINNENKISNSSYYAR